MTTSGYHIHCQIHIPLNYHNLLLLKFVLTPTLTHGIPIREKPIDVVENVPQQGIIPIKAPSSQRGICTHWFECMHWPYKPP